MSNPADAPQAQSPAGRQVWWALCFAIALLWWGVALLLRENTLIHIWTDQQDKFVLAASNFFQPYAGMSGFFSPPWAVVPLVPFEFMPLALATLLQTLIYFSLLGLIARRYQASLTGLLAALLSPLGLDAVLELNIDWIAAIGLVVPPQWSLIFLTVKPQAFPGYVFTLTRWQFTRGLLILLLTVMLSFLIWGVGWVEALYLEFGTRSLAHTASVSPWGLVPPLLSVLLGLGLLAYAFRQHDDLLKLLSGVFFTPYLPTYTAIIPMLFFCIRYPRAGAYLCFALWLITLAIVVPVVFAPP